MIFDDGWDICDQCSEAFSSWDKDLDGEPQNSGYHEGTKKVLCENCWERRVKIDKYSKVIKR